VELVRLPKEQGLSLTGSDGCSSSNLLRPSRTRTGRHGSYSRPCIPPDSRAQNQTGPPGSPNTRIRWIRWILDPQLRRR